MQYRHNGEKSNKIIRQKTDLSGRATYVQSHVLVLIPALITILIFFLPFTQRQITYCIKLQVVLILTYGYGVTGHMTKAMNFKHAPDRNKICIRTIWKECKENIIYYGSISNFLIKSYCHICIILTGYVSVKDIIGH